jgi:hypothetical protein
MTLTNFLTASWNNRFSLGLGAIFFPFAALTVFTATLPAKDAFPVLVLIGCVF